MIIYGYGCGYEYEYMDVDCEANLAQPDDHILPLLLADLLLLRQEVSQAPHHHAHPLLHN